MHRDTSVKNNHKLHIPLIVLSVIHAPNKLLQWCPLAPGTHAKPFTTAPEFKCASKFYISAPLSLSSYTCLVLETDSYWQNLKASSPDVDYRLLRPCRKRLSWPAPIYASKQATPLILSAGRSLKVTDLIIILPTLFRMYISTFFLDYLSLSIIITNRRYLNLT